MSPSLLARAAALVAVLVLALAPAPVRAQDPARITPPDSAHQQLLELRDGSTVVGRVVSVEGDTVRFATTYGVLALARTAIVRVRLIPLEGASTHDGEFWAPDPNATRLLFAPTGRMLDAGDGYFSDTYLFLIGFFRGVTPDVTIGGGMSIFPSDDFTNNVIYVAPKVGVVRSPTLNVAVGALAASVPDFDGGRLTFGGVYGVSTFGKTDQSFTLGGGVGFSKDGFSKQPVGMLGVNSRLSRRTAFVSENYLIPGDTPVLISYGIRFFGDRMAFDLAFWNAPSSMVFPGVPYMAFVSHF